MTREQIEASMDWYLPLGDLRIYLVTGECLIGRPKRRSDTGFTINGRRVGWSEVEAAESAMFA